MKNFLRAVRERISFYTEKRFSTIAGTLAYFLLMSIAPFILWLSLLLGNIDLQNIFPDYIFEGIKPFINYLQTSAQNALGGAGIILLATSLYSSTNFFYHLRRSGEIVFGSKAVRGGVKLRALSAVLILLTIFAIAFLAAFAVTGRWILNMFMPEPLCNLISFAFLAVLAFFCAMLLNIFACPYKISFADTVCGSALTTALWLLFALGFAVYLNFGSPGKLYGAIASVIVFLLWCYFLMCCLVIGMIKNGSLLNDKKLKVLL